MVNWSTGQWCLVNRIDRPLYGHTLARAAVVIKYLVKVDPPTQQHKAGCIKICFKQRNYQCFL